MVTIVKIPFLTFFQQPIEMKLKINAVLNRPGELPVYNSAHLSLPPH